jgi:polysaccharide export outer membrane protein
MSLRHAGRMLFAWSAVLGTCTLLGGCQSTSVGSLLSQHDTSRPQFAGQQPVLTPGMQLDWSIQTSHESPGLIKSGRSAVGPDGTIALGPYGTCKVGGLTPAQASRVIERQLAGYVRGPSVAVRLVTPDGATAQDVAWRPASKAARATSAPIQTVSAKQPARTVVFQAMEEPAPKPGTIPMPREVAPGSHDVMMAAPVVTLPAAPPAPDELKRVLLPAYVIGPPDVLQIESLKGKPGQPIRGPHLVRPDGTIGLGIYGSIVVAGLTVDQAKEVIARAVHVQLNEEKITLKEVYDYISVDVLAFNSKVYYVITDNAGQGEVVQSFPVTGNETVLDAISKINGLPPVASKRHIWVARRTRPEHPAVQLPVNWVGITQGGETATNYQIFPGDRVYVQSDRFYTFDRNLAKVLSPIERLFGASLLGSQTVNSIRSGAISGGTGGVVR